MSVLIKGMEMPKYCLDCMFGYEAENSDNEVFYSCFLTNQKMTCGTAMYGRVQSCPLVEVPTPHGDLIDRNKIQRLGNTAYGDVFSAPTVIEAEE